MSRILMTTALVLGLRAEARPPNATVVVTRDVGYSPLAIVFDATATTSSTTDAPFHELDYTWNFGDPGSSFVHQGYADANRAIGGVAAHVFELPPDVEERDYTVTLRVRDAQGDETLWQHTITVLAFDGPTYYVSSESGNDRWQGTVAQPQHNKRDGPFRSFTRAIQAAKPGVRILFRRGETWIVREGLAIDAMGPGMIGTYGTALEKPTLQLVGSGNVLAMSKTENWRVVEINFVGPYPQSRAKNGLAGVGVNTLVLRCDFSGFLHGILQATEPPRDGVVLQDNSFIANEAYGMFFNSGPTGRNPRHVALLANHFDRADTGHLARVYLSRSVISYNIFESAPRTQLRLLGPNPGHRTEYVIISENEFLRSDPALIMVQIGAQNDESVRFLENIIFERNVWDSGEAERRIALEIRGGLGTVDRLTMRNNLFVGVQRPMIANGGPHRHWKLSNNTAYRHQDDGAVFFASKQTIHDLDVRNNIASYPNAKGLVKAMDLSGKDQQLAQVWSDYNVWHMPNAVEVAQVAGTNYSFEAWQQVGMGTATVTEDPMFIAPSEGRLRLQSSSVGASTGSTAPWVFDDLSGIGRPRDAAGALTSGANRGAFENPAGPVPEPYPLPIAGTYVTKNRYLTFIPPPLPAGAIAAALRVTFTRMPDGETCPQLMDSSHLDGTVMWVGQEISIPSVGATGVYPLQETPLFRNWRDELVRYCIGATGHRVGESQACGDGANETTADQCHAAGGSCQPLVILSDCNIVPCASYTVQAMFEGAVSLDETFSSPVVLDTIFYTPTCPGSMSSWGDVVGEFDIEFNRYLPPDGCIDFNDIAASVEAFRNLPKAPPRTWVDLLGGGSDGIPSETMWQGAVHNIDFKDLQAVIDAFQGQAYPLAGPTGLSGPCP